MKQAYFVTGTDTGVGKTYAACRLIRDYIAQGYRVVGMKPVASGCVLVDGEWLNDDVRQLIQVSNVKAELDLVNPYRFEAPIAPHIAAMQTGVNIDFSVISAAFSQLQSMADIVIVEGAGGLLVPLNSSQTIADLIECLDMPIDLVVGMKLGCINHAALTYAVMQQRGLILHQWIANQVIADMQAYQENEQTLISLFNRPAGKCLPFQDEC